MENQTYLHLILLGAHFLLVFVTIFALVRVIRGVLRQPIANTQHSPLVLFISFGLTLLFFKDTGYRFVNILGRFFISPFEAHAFLSDNSTGDSGYFSEWLKYLLHAFSSLVLNIDYVNVVIFFVFWLLTSMLINEVWKSIRTDKEANTQVQISIIADTPIIKNLFTIFLIFFSIYLSVSSIIAVPEFQTLEGSSTSDVNIVEQFKNELDDNRVVTIDKLLLKEDTAKVSRVPAVSNLQSDLRDVIKEYNDKANQGWVNDENLKKTAFSRFKSAVDEKMAPKERSIYKRRLIDWYLYSHDFWTTGLRYHRSSLQTKNDEIGQFLSGYATRDTIFNMDSLGLALVDRLKGDVNNIKYGLFSIVEIPNNQASAPSKPQIGEEFGIFNTISGWLLRTESLSLALIVGLFGFGLLGAIGSVFIRKRTTEGNVLSTLSLAELQIILINGISAAIVIFLGVKGTVVVFTNSNKDDLNPYVLFFTCLVASVFSEDVWAWARKRLNQNLGNDQSGVGKGT
ncbi:MAG: hypothetical protein ACKVT2_13450 [Saprospiraceae bacterium]